MRTSAPTEYVKVKSLSLAKFMLCTDLSALEYSQFSHDMSNIVESVNGIWGELRDMPPQIMLDNIHTWTMKRIAERQQTQVSNNLLTPTLQRKYKDRLAKARSYTVTYAGQNIFQVDTPQRQRQEVNLSLYTCSCLNFEDYQSPCSHVIACCLFSSHNLSNSTLALRRIQFSPTFLPSSLFSYIKAYS